MMKNQNTSSDQMLFDSYILVITFVMLVVGITMVYSASSMISIERYEDPFYYFKRQSLWIIIGLGVLFYFQQLSYEKLEKLALPLLLVTILLLALVLIPGIGKEVGGGRRWLPIGIGSLSFQPSELAKISLIIFFASFLTKKKEDLKSFQFGFLPVVAIIGFCSLLIFKEPDMGNAVLILASLLTLFFVAGARLTHISYFSLAMAPFAYFALSSGFRAARIRAFLDPWSYSDGAGFQLIQSFYSFGRGGVFGEGLGNSQQKMLFLPEAHTDFIFSVIGEEFGLLGTLLVTFLFFVFAVRGFYIAKKAPDNFGKLLAVGITTLITYQALFNIAVTIGLVPTKGLPLPLISAGGSSMVFTLASIGILLNISKASKH
ncbi:MAG: putative lipid II flippase FtsW [Nitrospinae bacterium]|nr:putative lipid II flippase FtsW [Nitrospinota bacterium]